jgi:hypothetical protein
MENVQEHSSCKNIWTLDSTDNKQNQNLLSNRFQLNE